MKHLNKLATLGLFLAGSLVANAVNVTFKVSNADAVYMDVNDEVTNLKAGDNTFNLKEYAYATFSGISPWVITSVTNASGTPETLYGGMWYKYITSSDEGQVFTFTLQNLEDARTASCTVNVDDPTLVNAQLSGTYSPVTFNQGANTLKFDPETENTLILTAANYQKPIYKVTLNGADVPSDGGTYNIPLTQGCQIDVTAIIPSVPVTVNFTYSEKGAGALSSVAVDGQAVADFNGTSLTMTAGQSLTLNPNSLYNITGFTINGASQYWSGGYAYTLNTVLSDTEIHIEAHPYSTVNATLNVSDPQQIKVYRGYSYNNDVITLSGTTNTIQVPENNTVISWEAATGCYIESVKVNGEDYTSDNVSCTEGMTIDIVTKAIVMDKTTAVWIDDRSKLDYYFSFESNTREDLGSSFTSGYNIVDFYSGYTPFRLSWYSTNPVVGKVYVNNELKSPMYDGSSSYELNLADLDVVKLFYAAEPVDCNVTFNVAEGLDPNVIRDVICSVTDLTQPLACFAGTQIDITKNTKEFDVKVNGVPVTPLPETDDYRLTVTEPQTTVEVSKKLADSIGSIEAESTVASPVYNLQGVKVADTLEGLPAGIYITAGKKVVVK